MEYIQRTAKDNNNNNNNDEFISAYPFYMKLAEIGFLCENYIYIYIYINIREILCKKIIS